MKCKAIIFSDIHYAQEMPIRKNSKIERKLTHYAIPIVNKLIDEINIIKPDITINLGDLIEDSGNHDKDITDFKLIWNILKKITSPFYSLTGNHDLRSMSSRKELENIMGYNDSTFSIDLNGYHFIFLGLKMYLDKNQREKFNCVSDEDIRWLKEDLDKNKLPCLVFNHFGLAEDEMKGNWWFEDYPHSAVLTNRKEIKNILENNSNVIAVFSGHQHWTKELMEKGIKYFVVGSLTEDINSNGIPDGIYLEVDLDENDIKITQHNIRL